MVDVTATRPHTIDEATVETARADAELAAEKAGIEVVELADVVELAALGEVIDRIWRRSTPMIESGHLKAISQSGGYVVGALTGGRIVGGAVAWFGRDGQRALLHSHVAGFLDGASGGGRGRALKLHQRAWTLQRGIDTIEWTFDPLVRRNGWFNLVRLRARVKTYSVNHYGSLRDDGVNGSDESDRLVAAWDLTSEPVASVARRPVEPPDEEELRAAGAVDLLSESGETIVSAHELDDLSTALVLVPEDIISLRRSDPHAAAHWRRSTRAALEPLVRAGRPVSTMTRSGRYVLPPGYGGGGSP